MDKLDTDALTLGNPLRQVIYSDLDKNNLPRVMYTLRVSDRIPGFFPQIQERWGLYIGECFYDDEIATRMDFKDFVLVYDTMHHMFKKHLGGYNG